MSAICATFSGLDATACLRGAWGGPVIGHEVEGQALAGRLRFLEAMEVFQAFLARRRRRSRL